MSDDTLTPAPAGPAPAAVRGATTNPVTEETIVVRRRPGPKEAEPRRYKARRRRIELALGIVVPVALVGLWQAMSSSGVLTPKFFPTPSNVWSTGVSVYHSGVVPRLLWTSFQRVFAGFGMGAAAGLILGLTLGSIEIVRSALLPTVTALWMIPKLALLPLLIFFFGLTQTPVIVLIAIECMFLVLFPTLHAVMSVPHAYREAAQSFGATRRQMMRYVVVPGALPEVFVGLRLAAGAAVLVMVAAEFVDGKTGIGYYIFNSYQLFAPGQMYVAIVTVSVAGVLFTGIVVGIGRLLTRWQRA